MHINGIWGYSLDILLINLFSEKYDFLCLHISWSIIIYSISVFRGIFKMSFLGNSRSNKKCSLFWDRILPRLFWSSCQTLSVWQWVNRRQCRPERKTVPLKFSHRGKINSHKKLQKSGRGQHQALFHREWSIFICKHRSSRWQLFRPYLSDAADSLSAEGKLLFSASSSHKPLFARPWRRAAANNGPQSAKAIPIPAPWNIP